MYIEWCSPTSKVFFFLPLFFSCLGSSDQNLVFFLNFFVNYQNSQKNDYYYYLLTRNYSGASLEACGECPCKKDKSCLETALIRLVYLDYEIPFEFTYYSPSNKPTKHEKFNSLEAAKKLCGKLSNILYYYK